MTNAQNGALVLKNDVGDYFVLRQEVVERGRLSAEHVADIERALAAAQADDVAGHLNFPKITYARMFSGTSLGSGTVLGPVTTPLHADGLSLPPAGSGA
jgi:hypothetical protein